MKIFAYVGSRKHNSATLRNTKNFIHLFEKIRNEKIDYIIKTPQESNINECTGCGFCFEQLFCKFDDDMIQIINEIRDSDIIILGSPVYFHSISGSMKVFIDRISYLTHFFGFIGKVGITIDTSDTNGNIYVRDYLSKALEYLGVSVVTNLSIEEGLYDNKIKERTILQMAKKLNFAIESKEFIVSPMQDSIYSSFIDYVISDKMSVKEKAYWEDNYINNYRNFRECFNDKCTFLKKK